MKFYILITLLVFVFTDMAAQGVGWSSFERLYSDKYITAEISFKIQNGACDGTESVNATRYRYRVTGKARSVEYYLNWKMDYIDCNGNLYCRKNSLNIGSTSRNIKGELTDFVIYPDDEEFVCKSIETPFYEVNGEFAQILGSDLKKLQLSKDPESIIGETNIYKGDQTVLSVKGGTLGIGAKWMWYDSNCEGKPIGSGSSISVSPNETTTYFVRAESNKNVTKCAQITVNVSQLSSSPKSIEGNSKICKGESVNLKVSGGRLGLDAIWVWYEGACGDKEIGRSNSISVSPEDITNYYVRAEGRFNKTECASFTVYVYEKSYAPNSIKSTKVECANDKVTLTVDGGVLAKDAQWKWYGNFCGSTNYIGMGKTVDVVPMGSITYNVRAEGGCNNTDCVSIDINPDKLSSVPNYVSTTPKNGNKYQLTIHGGSLGKGAHWKWYKEECGKGRIVGTGSSITLHQRKPYSTYFVRAEGDCNNTNCVSQYIQHSYSHQFSPINDNRAKFLHLGIGVGLNFSSYNFKINETITYKYNLNEVETDVIEKAMFGIGLKGEMVFHPYMKDNFSIGFMTGGAIGSFFPIRSDGPDNNYYSKDRLRTLYSQFNLGSEMAAGIRAIKLLINYRSSIHTFSYLESGVDANYNYRWSQNIEYRQETVGAGLRFAPYCIERVGYRRGFCIDILYLFDRDYSWNWKKFDWSYSDISNFRSGAGLNIWVQSVLKMQLEFYAKAIPANSTRSQNNMGFQVSLIYNRNAFY